MDIVDESTLEALTAPQSGPCVSVYLPTHRYGKETEADAILFRNLLDAAEHEVVGNGMRSPDAAALLAEGRRLQSDHDFWQYQEDGLAFFAAPGQVSRYRVPIPFDETVVVGKAFHVKPLWPAVSRGERFSILALSRNRIRLLWGTRYRVGEIDLPDDVPESIAEALWFEDPERQLQYHGAGRVGRGRVVATFHGHGAGSSDDRQDERVERFFRAVDDGITHLVERERPLVLAGVDELVALYRRVSDHPTILDGAVSGNADRAAPDDLHERAWRIAEPHFSRVVAADREMFLAGGDRAVSKVEPAVTAALQARVATVFLPSSVQIWGTADAAGSVVIHEERQTGDRDLLDVAAVSVWRNGGRVHVVDDDAVPGEGPVAALLRY